MQSAMYPCPYTTGALTLPYGVRTNISIQDLVASGVFLFMTSGTPARRHSTHFLIPFCHKTALEPYHTSGMQGGGDMTPPRDF